MQKFQFECIYNDAMYSYLSLTKQEETSGIWKADGYFIYSQIIIDLLLKAVLVKT